MIFLCCFNIQKKEEFQQKFHPWLFSTCWCSQRLLARAAREQQSRMSGKEKISLALIEAIYFILTKDDEEGKKK